MIHKEEYVIIRFIITYRVKLRETRNLSNGLKSLLLRLLEKDPK